MQAVSGRKVSEQKEVPPGWRPRGRLDCELQPRVAAREGDATALVYRQCMTGVLDDAADGCVVEAMARGVEAGEEIDRDSQSANGVPYAEESHLHLARAGFAELQRVVGIRAPVRAVNVIGVRDL